jgi:segregation and condensation protein A
MNDQLPSSAEPSSANGDSEPAQYRIRVGEFEGPLDLLLHLVRINEVDITNIPIVPITEQYNAHLDMMRTMSLEIAGEYLVMAGTLMYIKSRMLLPPDPEAEEEEGAADPRAELTQQLIEYQRFKQAAENLSAMDSRRSLIWTRRGIPAEFEDEELLAVDLFDLLKAFRGLLGRLGEEARLQLKRDNVSVAEKISWLTDLLERRPSIDLLELLEDLTTRLDRIATFLAVLEMVRLSMIVVFQRKIRGEIRIAGAPDAPEAADGEAPEASAGEGRPGQDSDVPA